MRPDRIAFIDQLVEALRQESASGPVRVLSLSHRMPTYQWTRPTDGAQMESRLGTQDLYNGLRAAEKMGRCRRVPDPLRINGVLWEWVGDTGVIDDLERMWSVGGRQQGPAC